MNDITSQLDINFGSLPRPGRGSRGARGGRGRGRQAEGVGPRPEVVVIGFYGFCCCLLGFFGGCVVFWLLGWGGVPPPFVYNYWFL